MSDEPSDRPPSIAPPATSGPSTIGVPDGFIPPNHLGMVVRRDDRETRYGVIQQMHGSATYVDGDEFGPLNNPESVIQLQAQLANLGLLNPKNIRPGVWDSTSAAAYKKVLAFANQNGVSAQEAIKLLAANPTLGQLDPNAGRKPLSIELSNPLDIAAAAQQVAQRMLGRNLSEEDLKPIINMIQQSESGAQRKAYAMGGKGGTMVSPPSGEAQIEDYYKKNFGDEAYGYAAVERMNSFYDLLHSPVSGAPQ